MTSEDLPRRKKIRLEGYDYSANGLYFVMICVTKKYQVLWENVGANSVRPLCLPDKLTISAQYLAQYSEEVAYQHKFAIKSCGRTLFAPTMCQRVMQNIFYISKF